MNMTHQELVDSFLEEWRESYTDLESATIKSLAQRIGIWTHMKPVLTEEGWEV